MLYLGINQHKRCCLENMQTMRLDLERDPLPASRYHLDVPGIDR